MALNFKQYFAILSNFFYINLKKVYSTFTSVFVILLMPFLITFGLCVLTPINFFVEVSALFCVSLSAATIFGILYFPLKESTIFKNIFLTRVDYYLFILSILICMAFVTFISFFTMWLTILFFIKLTSITSVSLISSFNNQVYFDWKSIEWGIVIYYWIMSVSMIFLLAILAKNFFRTKKHFFIFVITFFLFSLTFSGLLWMNPFIYDESGNLIQKGIINQNIGFLNSDGEINNFQNRINFSFIVSIFLPFSSLNNFLHESVSSGIYINNGLTKEWIGNLHYANPFTWSIDWKWNLWIVLPYVQIAIYIITILVIKMLLKSKNVL